MKDDGFPGDDGIQRMQQIDVGEQEWQNSWSAWEQRQALAGVPGFEFHPDFCLDLA